MIIIKNKTIKIIVSLLGVFLVSFNCFAAVVSDNDGSAFITKAEFDSLKNNFQSQLDAYNTSIDSKIDNAISSYLAGINVSKTSKLVDEIKVARNNSVDNVTFASWRTPSSTKHVADVRAAFFVSRDQGSGNDRYANHVHGFHIINNVSANGVLNYVEYLGSSGSGSKSDYTSAYYFVNFPFATLDDANYVSVGNTDDWYLMSELRNRVYFTLTTTHNAFGVGHVPYSGTNWYTNFYHPTQKTLSTDFTSSNNTKNSPGSYTWSTSVRAMQTDIYPVSAIEHQWSFNDATSDTINNNFLKYNISGTLPNTTTNGVDFNFRDKYFDGQTFEYMFQNYSPSTTSHTGGRAGSEMYIMRWNGSADDNWWNNTTRYEAMNDYTFNFKWNMQKNYNLKWSRLTNKYYCGRFGKAHYKYYGVPICRTTKNPGKLKFKLKFTNTRTDSGSPISFRYQIMDRQFPNGAMPTTDMESGTDHVLKREVVPDGNATKEIEFEIEKKKIWNSANGDYIYLKIEPSGSVQRVSVETVDDIIYTEES